MIQPGDEQHILRLFLTLKTLATGRIVFYGAGDYCRDLLALLFRYNMPFPDVIMDDQAGRPPLLGIPVVTPDQAGVGADDVIVISAQHPPACARLRNNLIKRQIKGKWIDLTFNFGILKKSYQTSCDQEFEWHKTWFDRCRNNADAGELLNQCFPTREMERLEKCGFGFDPSRGQLSFLEIGTGLFPVLAAAAINGSATLLALDILADKYKDYLAKNTFELPVEWVNGSAENIPALLGSRSFDLIMMDNSLDHTLDPRRVLENCCRVLKPKGVLLIKSHVREGFRAQWAEFHDHDLTVEAQELIHYSFFQKRTALTQGLPLRYVFHDFYEATDPAMGPILCVGVAFAKRA